MKIEIRKATAMDAEVLAPLLFDSGPEAFQYVFNTGKKTALDFLRYSLTKKNGEFGYGCHSVVLIEDVILGVGAEFSGDNNFSFLLNNAWQIISFYKWRSPGVIYRGLQVEKVLVPPANNVHYIAHLDVDPNHRGKGIGEQLINHFIDHAKKLNRSTIELDVAVTNPRAKSLYIRLGFSTQHTRKSTLQRQGIMVPSYERMKWK